jgi:predicted O-methyltransferase YrrM
MNHFYHNIGENWFTYPNLYSSMVKRYDNAKFLEIGSWKGRSASFMAVEIHNSNKSIEFYCVDTWLGSDEHKNDEIIKSNSLYSEFLKNIEPVKHIIKPIRKSSLETVNDFKDETFDFIFIDAAHDYDNVSKDLEAWYPKLKIGGFFAGHDYGNGWHEVERAVNEWVSKNNFILEIKGAESTWGLTKK